MKRTVLVLVSLLIVIFAASSLAGAGPKKDSRLNGGTLSYGEYGRPATLDPIRATR